jgi:peptidoglycan hydrolase-like protein with peptidoglycan-binding domain
MALTRRPSSDPDGRPRRSRRVRMVALAIFAALIAAAVTGLLPTSSASADPSARDWLRLRLCESGNNYRINTGNAHYGAYQFDLATWRGVGGSGYPYQASPAEQDARALLLYRMRGWQPWQCAGIVGLREDRDARSGSRSGVHLPRAGGGGHAAPSPGSHAWPGVYYGLGDHSAGIRTWQLRMKARGAPLTGTGQFGNNTLAVVKRIQTLNHLPATGILGPNTWKLAWTGRY